jgi:hypothetical protein
MQSGLDKQQIQNEVGTTRLTKFDRGNLQDVLAISDCSGPLGSIDDAQKDVAIDSDQAKCSENRKRSQ